MTEENLVKTNTVSKPVLEKIELSVQYLEQQTIFIQKLMKAIQENKLNEVLNILDSHRLFVTPDFVQSFAGKAVSDYLVESATQYLTDTYSFLHNLTSESSNQKRTFYIGDWYKANTRHILFLAIDLHNHKYRLKLNIAPEVLEEWQQMDDVKGSASDQLQEKEQALIEARKQYDDHRAKEVQSHSVKLDELRKKYHTLTSKVLKKQSEIQEVDQAIKKETQIIKTIEEQPEIFFNEEHQQIISLQESIDALKARVENMNLIEALVKREKNEIKNFGMTVDEFINDIQNLAEQWKMNKE